MTMDEKLVERVDDSGYKSGKADETLDE